MYVLITPILLLITLIALFILRISRTSTSYSWLVATLGTIFAWMSILLWQMDLNRLFSPTIWKTSEIFLTSPEFYSDAYSWVYALSLTAVAGAIILTSPARANTIANATSWAGTLALTVLGLLAFLAKNPITLVLAWTAIDITEFFNTLRASNSPSLSERAVISLAIRSLGTGIAMWTSISDAQGLHSLSFSTLSSQSTNLLLLAVGLRLGVLPLHLTYRSEPVLRRGFGSILRLMSASTSLILLSRLPAPNMNTQYSPYLLLLIVLAAIYGGWNWLTAPDELNGRPYWIIGMSSLSLAAYLCGNLTGSAAFGIALVLFGGISFLYSARFILFTRILAGFGILLIGLPFTLTASGWSGSFVWPYFFWPMFISAHFMLVAGYVRHLISTGETNYIELPTWAQSAYPAGLGLLTATALLLSLWGWQGSLQTGNWISAVMIGLLGILAWFIFWRYKLSIPSSAFTPIAKRASRLSDFLEFTAKILWTIYRQLRKLSDLSTQLLEGDGGLLWTLLILVLFIISYRGR